MQFADRPEHFLRMVEDAVVGVVQTDADGRMVYVNPQWCAMLGYGADELLGRSVFEVTDPPYVAITRESVEQLRRGAASVVLSKRYRRRDGSLIHARSSASAIRDANGVMAGLTAFVVDVSDRVEALERAEAAEERLNQALQIGQMIAWEWNLVSGAVVSSTDPVEFWGIPVERVEDFIALVHPEDRPAVEQAAMSAFTGVAPYDLEYRVRGPDGNLRWIQTRGRIEPGPDGRPWRVLGIAIDVTGAKRAELTARLLAEAGQVLGASLDYETTLSSLAVVLVPRLADWYAIDLLTPAGELERIALHHPDPAKIEIGTRMHAQYPPRQDVPNGVWNALRTGEPSWVPQLSDELLQRSTHNREQFEMLRALGLRSYICVPLRARGVAIGVLTLVFAESGRHYERADLDLAMEVGNRAAVAVDNARLYHALQAADRRKDEFLAMLAHELRNPLAPINMAAELLKAVVGNNPQAREASEIIARQASHMTELVDDLLDVSRVTRGLVQLQQQPVDLKSVATAAVEQVRSLVQARRHELRTSLSAEPLIVRGDRARLIQVIVNLLNNAAKYTPPGGELELLVDAQQAHVRIQVSDSGVGIEPGLLQEIFELFTQAARTPDRSQGGLGIGLALVRSIVRLHGGEVTADSEGTGKGATFCVLLPRMDHAGPALPTLPTQTDAASSYKRVLVVDDNADAATMVAEVLRLHGHAVDVAGSGAGALGLVDDSRRYDAFVLDIGLPDMTGYELVRRLRALDVTAGARFFALTGYGQQQDRLAALSAGFDEHLVKPVDPERLVRLLAV
ncbi:PAS domain S-box protein [Lysobacter korlensis]|uniref:histidine kinase n=1 Tax=Lysobacter korlensis TaxID=553636 RepID=A0ABV6RM62_9GAMM